MRTTLSGALLISLLVATTLTPVFAADMTYTPPRNRTTG